MVPPLRVIQNLPNWIEDQLESGDTAPEAVAPNLRAIMRQAARVERLLADMTAFEALRYHQTVPFSFCPRQRILDLAARLFPDGPCVIEVYGEPSELRCDLELFDLVIGELLANAVIHNDNPAGYTAVFLNETDNRLAVTVTDDGPGIATEDRTRIFEPFEKVTPTDGIDTSGLGLAKVVRAAGLMNVELRIGDAEDGCGTAVTASFPRGGRT